MLIEEDQSILNYTDPEFPPQLTSLTKKNTQKYRKMLWKRLSHIYLRGDFQIMQNVSYLDPMQSKNLGNCSFVAAISAFATDPTRVEALITPKCNKSSKYTVKLFQNGKFHNIIIDDYFPFSNSYKNYLFLRVRNKYNLWCIIIEKAWAKFNKSYENLHGNISIESLKALTGAPSKLYTISQYSQEYIQNLLIKNLKTENPITLGSPPYARLKIPGLVGLHVYTLVNISEDVLSNPPGHFLIIRNPWGSCERLRERERDLGNGLFWIRMEELRANFRYMVICDIGSNFGYKHWGVISSPRELTFTLSDGVRGYFIVDTPRSRLFPQYYRGVGNNWAHVEIYLYVLICGDYQLVDSVKDRQYSATILQLHGLLGAGEYKLLITNSYPRIAHFFYNYTDQFIHFNVHHSYSVVSIEGNQDLGNVLELHNNNRPWGKFFDSIAIIGIFLLFLGYLLNNLLTYLV